MSSSKKENKEFKKILQDTIIPFVIVALVCFIVNQIVHVTEISGDSMLPTFRNSERVFGFTHHKLERGDVIVAEIELTDENGKSKKADIIKRVIAMSGDKIDLKYETETNELGEIIVTNCDVYVNDTKLEEPYILSEDNYSKYYDTDYTADLTKTMNTFEGKVHYPLVVPDGKIFVMGDNRNNSNDSRGTVGLIDVSAIKSNIINKKL